MNHNCTADCTAGWGSNSKCHCQSCGRNFLNLAAFDSHRERGKREWYCADPIAVGLHLDQSGFYGMVEGIAKQEKSGLLLQKARAARG